MTNVEAINILSYGEWYSFLPEKYKDMNAELTQAIWIACSALTAQDDEKFIREVEKRKRNNA